MIVYKVLNWSPGASVSPIRSTNHLNNLVILLLYYLSIEKYCFYNKYVAEKMSIKNQSVEISQYILRNEIGTSLKKCDLSNALLSQFFFQQ